MIIGPSLPSSGHKPPGAISDKANNQMYPKLNYLVIIY